MKKEFSSNSLIAKLICDKSFAYMQPWFYNHPFALRCELGIGDINKEYIKNALNRANEIFDIIFEDGVDALFFNYYFYNWCDNEKIDVKFEIKSYKNQIKDLAKWFNKYPHKIVGNLPSEIDEDCEITNRIVCFVRDYKINYEKLIKQNITAYHINAPISFVSYKNECIMSIYDDRGCDIVFANKEKMCEFFTKLKPYLLDYDMEEMKNRIK